MLIGLVLASITDTKKREIPIWLFPSLVAVYITLHVAMGTMQWINSLVGLFIGALAFTIAALFFQGGGGDILMMSAIGFVYGPVILSHITIGASIGCICYYCITKQKNIPYAPIVLISYILCFAGGYLYEIDYYRLLAFRYFLL